MGLGLGRRHMEGKYRGAGGWTLGGLRKSCGRKRTRAHVQAAKRDVLVQRTFEALGDVPIGGLW